MSEKPEAPMRIDCQICGGRGAVCDSAKPSFMTDRSARIFGDERLWMYCSDCSYPLEELNKRRKSHKLPPLEVDGALRIEIKDGYVINFDERPK